MRNTISAVQKTVVVAGFLAAGALASIMPAAAGAGFSAQDSVMAGASQIADMTVVSPAVNDPSVGAADPNWQIGVQTGNVEGDRAEVIGDSTDHVGDCLATFKSYNVSTDSYMAFDGTIHRCKL